MSKVLHTVRLECEHRLQFQKPLPEPGELLWCKTCNAYNKVYGDFVLTSETYFPDWSCKPSGEGYEGKCYYDPNVTCHPIYAPAFHELSELIYAHQIRVHGYGRKHTSLNSKPPLVILSTNERPPF